MQPSSSFPVSSPFTIHAALHLHATCGHVIADPARQPNNGGDRS
jgi:hypothetical protein